jgi:hypothetical protein
MNLGHKRRLTHGWAAVLLLRGGEWGDSLVGVLALSLEKLFTKLFAIRLESVILAPLFDSLLFSRHGESSVELSSVMIRDPMIGNSLAKAMVRVGQ